MSKKILILGGGTGGLITANELQKRLGGKHQITLIEKKYYHEFAPSFVWLMVNNRHPEEVRVPIQRIVRKGVEVVIEEVKHINTSQYQVETENRKIPYDYLVIALGAELAPELTPGLSNNAHTFYSFDGTLKLQKTLESFSRGRLAIVLSSLPYKCPGAPNEGALLLDSFFRKRGIRNKIDMHLFTPEPYPMPVSGPQIGNKIKEIVESRGIAVHVSHKPTSVNQEDHTVIFNGNQSVKYDLLIVIPPHRAPKVVRESELANDKGWIPVNHETLETKSENVYAIGDVTTIPIPGRWNPDTPMVLPKVGTFAHGQAKILARRIEAKISHQNSDKLFDGIGLCIVETGNNNAELLMGDFYSEPTPDPKLMNFGKLTHLGKVLFEKWWLSPYGARRQVLNTMITTGLRFCNIPIKL